MTNEPRTESTITFSPKTGETGGLDSRSTAEPLEFALRLAAGESSRDEVLFGRYRLERKLGAGGMGTVYLTWDPVLCRHVALKVCRVPNPLVVQRFLQEARAAAALQHPNICQVYDFQNIEDIHCLFMPYFEGAVLKDRTVPGNLLPTHEAARIVRTVALAMQAAHDAGVIHRDLKPSNIILDSRREPIVVDFGLARRSTDSGLTLGGPMGTPAYMPPEQCAGDFSLVGPHSDVYSLGMVLFELLTGTLPFDGNSRQLINQHQSALPPLPSSRRPEIDPRFDLIVATALAKRPDQRWATMRAFADALSDLTTATPTPTSGPELILSVVGSSFAYRPPPGWTILKIGRRRRKPGAPDGGNDLVIRVAGNEELSTRISRLHFEIRRTPTGFSVIDRSTMGLTQNGVVVPKGCETPLNDGDLLGLAGVVNLKVALAMPDYGVCQVELATIPLAASKNARIELEASLGDVVTLG